MERCCCVDLRAVRKALLFRGPLLHLLHLERFYYKILSALVTATVSFVSEMTGKANT